MLLYLSDVHMIVEHIRARDARGHIGIVASLNCHGLLFRSS